MEKYKTVYEENGFPKGTIVTLDMREDDGVSLYVFPNGSKYYLVDKNGVVPLFQVGDVVRIRQWDDMEREFGLDGDGDIDCSEAFTLGMRELCGKEFTIEECNEYRVEGLDTDYIITPNMIEHTDTVQLKRGMRVTLRDGEQFIVDSVVDDTIHYIGLSSHGCRTYSSLEDEDFLGTGKPSDIVKVEDSTLDGYEVVWELKEELFYLKNPLTSKYLNYIIENESYWESTSLETKSIKTRFTRDEINNLPLQAIVKEYIKVPIKEVD